MNQESTSDMGKKPTRDQLFQRYLNIIRAKSEEKGWDIEMGEMARIWKGGCIIRAAFLDDIRQAYVRNPDLKNLLLDPMFAQEIVQSQESWRRVVAQAIQSGISVSGISSSGVLRRLQA